MSSQTLELLKVLASFAGGAVGAAFGAILKDWLEKRNLRAVQRQTRWLPLLEAARELQERFVKLQDDYRKNPPDSPWSKDQTLPSWAGDFCELYTLQKEHEPIRNLEDEQLNPDAARENPTDVHRTRIRMCHQLNYAASSMYFTAKYLGYAQQVRKDLNEGRLYTRRKRTAEHMLKLLSDVRESLQGEKGAGVISEQQDSIGANVWGSDNGVISYSEFQNRLLKSPGWEQFTGLFRFFVDFKPKLEFQVKNTINTLDSLCSELKRVFVKSRVRTY